MQDGRHFDGAVLLVHPHLRVLPLQLLRVYPPLLLHVFLAFFALLRQLLLELAILFSAEHIGISVSTNTEEVTVTCTSIQCLSARHERPPN